MWKINRDFIHYLFYVLLLKLCACLFGYQGQRGKNNKKKINNNNNLRGYIFNVIDYYASV